MKKIKDIKNNDYELTIIARIDRVHLLTSSIGQNYISMTLADNSGSIEARKWTISEEDKANLLVNQLILLKKGIANEYRGQLQLKINDYQIIEESKLIEHHLSLDDFYVSAPIDAEITYKKILSLLEKFKNKVYREITLSLLKKYKEKFVSYPAAMSIHHNVKGGLLWHSYSLVHDIQALKTIYDYASIDWELLLAGAILHDLGKVIELEDINGTDYSLEGKLLGHISLGNAEIENMGFKLGFIDYEHNKYNQSVTLLQHLILASHGKYEFGSPIEPHLIEGIILSTLDNLDARIYRVNEELNKVSQNTWTHKLSTEGNKMFYKHHNHQLGDKKEGE